jgi:tRNA threonylcarbamoyladenosine biosynthesis protein TsaB
MLLALDTSTQWIGLALYDGVQVLGEEIWQTHNHHTVEIAPAIQRLMSRCSVLPSALEGIGVALGPGSFTSLRIGLAVAKGMALALRLPVAGIPSLDVLAAGQPLRDLPLAAILQSGRNKLALGWYDVVDGAWKSRGEAEVTTAEALTASIHKPTLVAGELTAAERQTLARKRRNVLLASPAQAIRRPAVLAELAWERLKAGQADEINSLAPIYLRTIEAIAG